MAADGKFREEQGVYYFKSYHDIDMEWFLRLCNLARTIAGRLHADDKFFARKKVYFELGCLDELLCGRIPEQFKNLYDQYKKEGLPSFKR